MSRLHTKRTKPIIGLAGGIGAGKSTVARLLESLGAAVIDSDRLAHEELEAPDVIVMLRAWWGSSVCTPDGEVDRKKIGGIIFDHPAERVRLEDLLYPRIRERREELIAAYESDPKVKAVVLDTPKLFEVGLNKRCDTVFFVEADRSVRVRRVSESRNWTEEELKRRENLQKPLNMKKASADHVISNYTDIEELRSQVERVFSSVLASIA